MAKVEIDDRLYLEAQAEFDRWEIDERRGGTGEVFWSYLDNVGVAEAPEKGNCSEALADLLGHGDGRYSSVGAVAGERGGELRRIVWSFHRAWVDRYGWTHAMPERA